MELRLDCSDIHTERVADFAIAVAFNAVQDEHRARSVWERGNRAFKIDVRCDPSVRCCGTAVLIRRCGFKPPIRSMLTR